MLWNPWRRIKQLEQQVASYDLWLGELEDRLRDAERGAWLKAEDHFHLRTANLRAQNEALLKQMVDIASLTPPTPFVILTEQGK